MDKEEGVGFLVIAGWDDTAATVEKEFGSASPVPVMLDSGNELVDRYGIEAPPAVVLVDRDGKIVSVEYGGTTADEISATLAGLP